MINKIAPSLKLNHRLKSLDNATFKSFKDREDEIINITLRTNIIFSPMSPPSLKHSVYGHKKVIQPQLCLITLVCLKDVLQLSKDEYQG